jgi:2-polyprenyl-6-methoxyphenol hydroxylase-like FAD-dependent oxidoreductase
MTRLKPEAVVLGAGMAGLLAARVLSEFYASVTVVERDTLPDHPSHRRGVPQGRHLHHLLSRGTQVLGEFFPGLLDELAAAGAVVLDDDDLSRIYARVGRYELNRSETLADPEALVLYLASRPFLEFHVRRRVAALDNVTIIDGHDVVEPLAVADAVTGVRIVDRATGTVMELNTGLVVDATGRAARTTAFLDGLGYQRPPEKHTAAIWGYSSQLMSLPIDRIAERILMVDKGIGTPRGLLLAYEHDTWMLAIGRSVGHGDPPADFADMLTLAESMFPATAVAALHEARPIGDTAIFRHTAAVWRRYDRMPRFPSGLLVIGDALCSLNPLYGQGMTVAALQTVALRDCLRLGDADLAQRFFRAAAGHIGPVWAMNQANEIDPSSTRRAHPLRRRLANWSANAALKAAANDIAVTERFFRVNNLLDPPTRLRDPALLPRILLANIRHHQPSATR